MEKRSTRILVAEDEPQIRHYVLEILADEPDLELTFVTNGEEAIEALVREPWDLVISDQRMGITDGVEVLGTAALVRPAAMRMMMTGFAELPLIASAKNEGGVHKFLSKPFSPTQFRETVGELVERSRGASHREAAFRRAARGRNA